MSKKTDIDNLTVTSLQQEQQDRDSQNLLMMQDMDGDMGKGIIALLAMFLGFMRDPSGGSLNDNQAVKSLFKSVGFSEKDVAYANETGQRLKNGEITAVQATKTVFDRIKEPETTFSSSDAKRAVENLNPNFPEKFKDFTVDDRQTAIVMTIPLAAEAAGVSPHLMKGMWGVESSFGTNLVSGTGCEGDWQFSQGTWDTIMERYGDKIVEQIKEDYPDRAADIAANHSRAGTLNEYQYDPIVSTYAAAFLMKDDAKTMGIDPTKRQNWGMTYAAYNVGSGNARKLVQMEAHGDQRAAMGVIGSAARHNPMFYKGGANAHLTLTRYDSKVEQRLVQYQQKFGSLETELAAKAKAASADSEVQVAQNDSGKDQSTQQSLTAVYNHNNENGGVKEETPGQPEIILADKFKKVMENGGTDEVALAAAEAENKKPQPEDGEPSKDSSSDDYDGPTAIASTGSLGMGGAA